MSLNTPSNPMSEFSPKPMETDLPDFNPFADVVSPRDDDESEKLVFPLPTRDYMKTKFPLLEPYRNDVWIFLTKNLLNIFNFVLNLFLLTEISKLIKKGYDVEEKDLKFEIQDYDQKNEKFSSHLRKNDHKIVKTVFDLYRGRFLFFLVPKLVEDVIVTLRPLLVYKILSLFSSSESGPPKIVLLFMAAQFVLEFVNSNVHELFVFSLRKFRHQVKYTVTYSFYKKILRLMDLKEKSDVINLISTEIDRLVYCFQDMYTIPSHVVKFVFSFTFLYFLLGGYGLIAIVIVFAVLIPINYFAIRYCTNTDKKIRELTDKRVELINEVIANIKMVKSFFWEKFYHKKINDIREEEISKCKKNRIIWSAVEMLWYTSTFFITAVSFVTYTWFAGKELSVPVVFSTITIIGNLTWPLFNFSFAFNNFAKAKVSIKRMQDFLRLKEIEQLESEEEEVISENVIEMENCSFSWKKKEEKVEENEIFLKDISVKIKRGEFVCMIGRIGSGKTSFCSSILGEMNKISGDLTVNSQEFSYCAQNHWVQNGTIRSNIIFGSPMNKSKLKGIIKSCALDKDLKQFKPTKDLTVVGERGVTLSGGQQARIAIARSIYKEKDVYIYDDSFKDLDVNVSNHIFKKVMLEELKGKTRILITHQTQFLPFVDKIIVLKDGKIDKCGSYEQLKTKCDFKQILKEEEEETKATPGIDELKSPLIGSPSTTANVEKPKITLRGINFKMMYEYFSIHLKSFIVIMIFIFLRPVMESYRDYFVSKWTEDFKLEKHSLQYYISFYLFIGISIAVLIIVSQVALAFVILENAKFFHRRLLNSILNTTISWFNKTPSGEIISRFSEDQNVLDTQFRWRLREFFFCSSFVVITYLFIFYLIPLYAIPCIPIFVIVFVIAKRYFKVFLKLSQLDRGKGSEIISCFNESINGISTIRAFREEKKFCQKILRQIQSKLTFNFNELDIDWYICVRGRALTLVAIFIFNVLAVFLKIKPEIFGLVYSKLFTMLFDIVWLMFLFPGIQRDMVSLDRILQYCKIDSEKYDGDDPKSFPTRGKIEFEGVFLKYDKDFVLKNLSFVVNDGERVGIIGRTGAGKSSLIKILLRLFPLNQGSIKIDDHDIQDLSLESLRSNLCYISQNPTLFNGTLRENLSPKLEYTDTMIWDVLEEVGIKEKVKTLKSLLDTNVEDIKFSCGEKQILLFARALLKNKKILVLDEATSSCDSKTDAHVQNIVRTKFTQSTIFCVAHRLETIVDMDKILCLERGELVDYDTPKNLLSNKDSLFYRMIMETGKERSEELIRIANSK